MKKSLAESQSSMDNKDIGYVVGMLILCIIALGAGPILLIWSVNTLFGLHTPFNWTTWLAGLVFLSLMKGSVRETRK